MFANTQMGGTQVAYPDVLLTPMPAPTPVPYENTALTAMGVPPVSNIYIAGMPAQNMGTVVPLSNGNNAGVAGVTSGTVQSTSVAVTGASTVLFEGQPATRLSTQTSQNSGNVAGAVVTPSQTTVLVLAG